MTPGTEVPERATVLRDACLAAGATLVAALPHDDSMLHAVHDPGLLAHLETIADEWAQGEYERLVGQDRVVPYVFPTEGMLDGLPAMAPTATHAKAGLWCYDTMTLVGPGTWAAARSAVDVAQTAVDLVARRRTGRLRAHPPARPPRHPAGLRRVVLPQQRGRRRRGPPRRRGREGRSRRRRRAPRQRHAGGVLGAAGRALRLAARRPGGRLVPAPRRVGRRARRGSRRGHDRQRAAGPGHRRHRLAGRAGRPAGSPDDVPPGGSRRVPRRGRRRRRPREPARRDHRRVRRRRCPAGCPRAADRAGARGRLRAGPARGRHGGGAAAPSVRMPASDDAAPPARRSW